MCVAAILFLVFYLSLLVIQLPQLIQTEVFYFFFKLINRPDPFYG